MFKLKRIIFDPVLMASAVLFSISIYFYFEVTELQASIRKGEVQKFHTGDEVTITKIIDGDEVSVRGKNGQVALVRILGIKAFHRENHDRLFGHYGRLSFDYLSKKWLNKTVTAVFGATTVDERGRLLAYLEHKQESGLALDIGLDMIRNGSVVTYTEFQFEREATYLKGEQSALMQKRGLWRDSTMVSRIEGLRALWAEKRQEGQNR